MMESYAYELMKKEGYEEGVRSGIEQGLQQRTLEASREHILETSDLARIGLLMPRSCIDSSGVVQVPVNALVDIWGGFRRFAMRPSGDA